MFKVFLTIVISSLFFATCCTCSVNQNSDKIPEVLIKSSNRFVISKTGEEFFNNNIKPNYEKITKITNGYLMVYTFSIPDKKGIEGEIRFSIDTLGNVQKNKEIVGIPECLSNPENCSFNISKEEAVIIASTSGLEKGVKNWDVHFKWNSIYKKYAWEIISTLSESNGTEFQRANGKTMLIDPANGNIIETSDWQIH